MCQFQQNIFNKTLAQIDILVGLVVSDLLSLVLVNSAQWRPLKTSIIVTFSDQRFKLKLTPFRSLKYCVLHSSPEECCEQNRIFLSSFALVIISFRWSSLSVQKDSSDESIKVPRAKLTLTSNFMCEICDGISYCHRNDDGQEKKKPFNTGKKKGSRLLNKP